MSIENMTDTITNSTIAIIIIKYVILCGNDAFSIGISTFVLGPFRTSKDKVKHIPTANIS